MVRKEQSARYDIVHSTRGILYRGAHVRRGQKTSQFHLDRNIPIFDLSFLCVESLPLPRHILTKSGRHRYGHFPRRIIARDMSAREVCCKTRALSFYRLGKAISASERASSSGKIVLGTKKVHSDDSSPISISLEEELPLWRLKIRNLS